MAPPPGGTLESKPIQTPAKKCVKWSNKKFILATFVAFGGNKNT